MQEFSRRANNLSFCTFETVSGFSLTRVTKLQAAMRTFQGGLGICDPEDTHAIAYISLMIQHLQEKGASDLSQFPDFKMALSKRDAHGPAD